MTFCVAFHSYKGGTGKTTIASNLSVELAKQGNVVVLLDMDLYSPSLSTYFELKSESWINDFLYSSASINSILRKINLDLITENDKDPFESQKLSRPSGLEGSLYIGLANSTTRDFQKLDVSGIDNQKHYFHKLVSLRDLIISKYNPDYIILDTSPGVRYWSLNALAISDLSLLTLKMGDIDIKGTQIMIQEIYNSFLDTGSKSFLLLNRVAGYCVPHSNFVHATNNYVKEGRQSRSNILSFTNSTIEETNNNSTATFDLDIISHIPCFCDIQFKNREYLTSLYQPNHPFSHKLKDLAKKIDNELEVV